MLALPFLLPLLATGGADPRYQLPTSTALTPYLHRTNPQRQLTQGAMAASAHLARKGLFIVGAKRTPFGAFGGKLKGFSATELAYLASKAALTQAKVDPKASAAVPRYWLRGVRVCCEGGKAVHGGCRARFGRCGHGTARGGAAHMPPTTSTSSKQGSDAGTYIPLRRLTHHRPIHTHAIARTHRPSARCTWAM